MPGAPTLLAHEALVNGVTQERPPRQRSPGHPIPAQKRQPKPQQAQAPRDRIVGVLSRLGSRPGRIHRHIAGRLRRGGVGWRGTGRRVRGGRGFQGIQPRGGGARRGSQAHRGQRGRPRRQHRAGSCAVTGQRVTVGRDRDRRPAGEPTGQQQRHRQQPHNQPRNQRPIAAPMCSLRSTHSAPNPMTTGRTAPRFTP